MGVGGRLAATALGVWLAASGWGCGRTGEPAAADGSRAGVANGPGAAPGVLEVLDALSRPDLLPRFRDGVRTGMVSSYDRSGGNDDGFSGKYSFIRRESGGLVLADLAGPGAVTRIHTPTPTEDIVEFYFDGEAEPRLRLKVVELFDGSRPPFVAPLAGWGGGGYFSYVPLTYRKSCKILLRAAAFQFYDINYAVFPDGTDVATYEEPPSPDFAARLERAAALLRRTGSDFGDAVAPAWSAGEAAGKLTKQTVKVSLASGSRATLFESRRPGRIVGLRLGPAAAFAGDGRDILLRAYWDGDAEPAIDAPVGDLFGFSFGEPAARSLLFGTAEDGRGYLYFPMPYERSARIELVSERSAGAPVEVEAEIVTAAAGKGPDEGLFYARWRRENPCVTGRPFTFLRAAGRGHVVGVILQAQGLESGHTGFFEGDDRAVIDGELAVPGTGSEDSFNGGWYDVPGRWEKRLSLPLSGCLDYKKPLARTGGYRLFLSDAYAFARSIDHTIEHGPEGNAVPTDYASVVYFYADGRPEGLEPARPAAERRVAGLDRVVFVPGWSVPIHTTSFGNATFAKAVVTAGDKRVRVFSMRTGGADIFGPHHIAFICDLPEAGSYRVSIKAVLGPDQGLVRVYERDRPAGRAVDLFAAERTVGEPAELGVFEMDKGENVLYLNLVGADPKAKGMGMDLAEIIFERVR
mgnify:FL=1